MVKNLFELTEEQISTSKMMYGGKVLKCLVAPYHSNKQIEEMLEFSPTTFLFPEKEMSLPQVKNFISMIVSSTIINDEVRIITTSQNIIMDMVDDCVRILTEGGDIVESPEKTFMANIHTIRYSLLENKSHQISVSERENGTKIINNLITEINEHCDNKNPMDRVEFEALTTKIKLIGEPIIRVKLLEMASEIKVVGDDKAGLLVKAQDALDNGDIETAKNLINQLENL